MNEEPLYAVVTPMQNDGLADWINAEFRVWIGREDDAREWALKHEGVAVIFRCVPMVEIQRVGEPKVIENECDRRLGSSPNRSLFETFQELQALDLEEFRSDVNSRLGENLGPRVSDDNGTT